MGSRTGDADERKTHEVCFDQPRAVSAHEVTFDEYDRYARATNADQPSDNGWGRGRRPVTNVSWDDAVGYAKWLARQTGKRFRLPTEAEWEYAARAGTQTDYSFGSSIGKGNANCADCGSEFDGKKTAPVGSFKANSFGLYDMHGNAQEWVQDCYHDSYAAAPRDGSAWVVAGKCDNRVVRGGSWDGKPAWLRSSSRNRLVPSSRNYYLGFRIARDL